MNHKLTGRPKGAYSKVSPKIRNQILRQYDDGMPVASIARAAKISRQYVYDILKEHGVDTKSRASLGDDVNEVVTGDVCQKPTNADGMINCVP